jgi:GAF domain-containing protein
MPHSLRRTFASLLFAIGETPPYVMAQMGHTTPNLTLAIYARQMNRRDGEPQRLKALVEGRDSAAASNPVGDDFVMANEHGLLPARGHRPESRQEFRLPIKDSFAGVAFNTGRVQSSNDLSNDERFKPHPKADSGREYQSMVSVPLWGSGEVDGVLNVLATRKNAFSPVDRTYITLLASVIDLAEHLRPSD